jgi:uncharacterized protein YciU (UPF0263 family)
MRTHYVMDYETLSNCFVAVFEDVKSTHTEVFVIHDLQNDLDDLIDFLERNISLDEWHVSFNGLGFDSQITEYIIRNADQLREMGGCEIAEWLYGKAQNIIQSQDENRFLEFSPKDLQINQVDVFKLNHWDNPAKRSSLKWIQFTMDWENIVDMPIHHSSSITSLDQINDIIRYCKNDVSSTKKIAHLSKNQIALRKQLTDEYNINLFSASEPKISKELFLHFLSKKLHVKKYDLKGLRTRRESIVVNDIVLDYINFKTATFQKLLTRFKEVVIIPTETKGGFKYSIQYKGVKTDFGLGGIHGARTGKVYESSEDMVIMSSDVTSFYPNLAIRNGWSPAHIPKEEFCEQYEWFFEERKKISKKDIRNYVYKIILNSTYGLSNDENSFLYDPEFTMRITINGQLSLAMLYEMLTEEIPGAIPLMQNTDGLETIIPKKYQDKYYEICKKWEEITNLQLEHEQYSKMIIGDVNNYIALLNEKELDKDTWDQLKQEKPYYVFVERDGKYYYQASKCKGRFEFTELALHKNKSFAVIPIAIYNYFVKGIKPEDYMKTNKNIYDYCGGKKIKGDWKFIEEFVSEGNHVTKDLQNTIRYYIANKGSKIVKYNYLDKRQTQVEAGKWLQKLFIDYVSKPFEEYDINYDYYLNKVYKEIRNLEPDKNQLSLF